VKQIVAADNTVCMRASTNGGVDQVSEYRWKGFKGFSYYYWAAVTGTNTTVAQIAAVDNKLDMVASNDGGRTYGVWQYSGSGTSWTALTGPNTQVAFIWVDGADLFMYASNDGGSYHVWRYAGTPGQWALVS
jgi:hypothetical protein